MSKEMKGAYKALNIKDWCALAAVMSAKWAAFIVLIALVSALVWPWAVTKALLVMGASVAVMGIAYKVIAKIADFRIRQLGFTEIALERMALA